MMQISTPSSNLKCPTCKIFFDSEEVHKQHYKSDFHRYNLKRCMVNLAPATIQQFSTKRSDVKNPAQANLQCGQCRKTFASVQTLNQHAQSKKHNINMIREARPEKLIQSRPTFIIKNEKRCLFCLKQCESLSGSLDHMRRDHSFFVPQENYCLDKTQLILYLQEKIQVGMMCICCDNKGAKDFASGQAVRKHMLSKNHTFMKTQNGYEEYEEFYDFSELFKEKLNEQRKVTVPLGINYEKVKVIVDDEKKTQKKQKPAKAENEINQENADGEDQDWDDVESNEDDAEQEWQDQSDDDSKQAIEQKNEDNQKEMEEKRRRKIKTYQIMVPTLTSTDELLLPNGKMLGHRKYRHIYRQAVKINNWFQNNKLSMLESGANQHALILKNNLMELIKKERVTKKLSRRDQKNWVNSGIQNSDLYRHFRSSNPK